MIFCLSTFIIIPLLVDLFEQEYYTKCFVIVFLFILSVKGLCKKIVQKPACYCSICFVTDLV
mgnify:CR=1 FL=1